MNSKKEFARWVKQNDPFLYQVAVERYKMETGESGLAGIGDFFNSVINTVKEVAPSIVNLQSQKKILDIQLKRAEQNLPPLDTTQYSPVVRIAPEITPETQRAAQEIATQTMTGGIKQLMPVLLIGGGLLAFMILKKGR